MGGVANVCRPTSWAGPRPSRKSLNWASEESLTPGKMRLKQRRHKHGDERHSFINIRQICRGAVRKSLELCVCTNALSEIRRSFWSDLRISVSLLSLGAVAVHAAVCGLPAGLPSHPAPHLHRQARLRAPLDGAAQLLAPCFCPMKATRGGREEGGRAMESVNA